MAKDSIILEKVYNAPLEMVWKAITEREQMKLWYFELPKEFKAEVGSVFDWMGGPADGKQWLHRGKVVKVIENNLFSHTWEYPGYSGTSLVTWQLTAIDSNTTKLLFTHEFSIPFDANEEALRRENFVAGWDYIINTGLTEFLSKS